MRPNAAGAAEDGSMWEKTDLDYCFVLFSPGLPSSTVWPKSWMHLRVYSNPEALDLLHAKRPKPASASSLQEALGSASYGGSPDLTASAFDALQLGFNNGKENGNYYVVYWEILDVYR